MAASCYDQNSTLQRRQGLKLIERLSVKKGHCVLDLGCGTGQLALVLSEKVGEEGRIVAIDPEEERIKLAQERNNASNIEYTVASDKNFPEDQKYDIVICTSAIHWIEDKTTTFNKVYANLKPGGQFGFTTLDNPAMPVILKEMLEMCSSETVKSTVDTLHFESAEFYKELAKSAGFEIFFIDVYESNFSFPDIDAFVNYWHGVFHGKLESESSAVEGIKRKYKDQKVDYFVPRLNMIVNKPF